MGKGMASRLPRKAARPPLTARFRHSRRETTNENDKGVIMRSGNWRGVVVALGVASALWIGLGTAGMSSARADGFNCTIPDLVPAVNLNTGGPYYAPPVPHGHYVGLDLHGHLMG